MAKKMNNIKIPFFTILAFLVFSPTYAQREKECIKDEIVRLNKLCESSAHKSVFSVSDSDLLKRKSNNNYECEFRISHITELKKHNGGFYKDLFILTKPKKISVLYQENKTKGSITVISFASETDRDKALKLLAELAGLDK
jgi:hypothetical protein